jgi:hypothetical protein
MRRNFRALSTLLVLATGLLAATAAVVAQQTEQQQAEPQQAEQQQLGQEQATGLPPGQVPAVLQSREVDFIYRSSTNPLSCDDLRRHISVVLRAVGARDDVQVTAHECASFIAPDPTSAPSRSGPSASGTFDRDAVLDPSSRTTGAMDRMRTNRSDRYRAQTTPVHIQLMMPAVVTPEILAEIDRDKSRRQLISRVTNNPAAALDDAILFAAERREITLSHDTVDLEAEDCELLEQMVPSVFRALDLKVTSQTLACDPRQRSHFLPHLTVDALLPVGLAMPGEQKKNKKKRQPDPAPASSQ